MLRQGNHTCKMLSTGTQQVIRQCTQRTLVAIIINKNKYFEAQKLSGPWKVPQKMSSILEFLGFSFSTPARVALGNVSVCKKEKEKEKKKRPRY